MTDFGNLGPYRRGDKLLEQYEVIRLLGTGGHAFVYECRDPFLDELLAVKVIPNPPNRGDELLARARAEAQLLRRLSHPNVVRMHTAAALGDDMVCLVMEKLEGVTLRHLLALLGRLSVVEAATIVRQIAVGVSAAHQLNVVHRDIKPDNAFVLPPNNHVKVLDFGIAKFLGQGLQTSAKYRFQGTPLYMSPEHLRGAGVTVRSDVYQLGTVMFELIAGMNPNLVDLDNPGFEQVAFVQITRRTPNIASIVAEVPPNVDWLLQKATAKSPEQRFSTMDEFVQALDQTMREYLATYPDELKRIRFVDDKMMQAARALAESEEEACASSKSGARHRKQSGATEPMPLAPNAEETPWQAAPSASPTPSRQPAAFHPIPRVTIPEQEKPLLHSPSAPPQSAARQKGGLSLTFVALALAFGATVGLAFVWLVPRGRANAGPAPADSVPQGSATQEFATALELPVVAGAAATSATQPNTGVPAPRLILVPTPGASAGP